LSPLPQALAAHPELDSWVRVDASSTITVFTGKVELGQGLLGALARIAADELDVALARVRVCTADTGHGLDERFTAGSLSMMDSGTALRQAACEVRALLVELAAERLGVAVERLEVADGTIADAAGAGSVSYWELTGGRPLRRLARGDVEPKPAHAHRLVGSGARNRIDLRGLIDGTTRFVADLRSDGMLHGRVVRPPSPAATLQSLEDGPVRELAGVVALVRHGSFIGVLAEREEQAVAAAELARRRARWAQQQTLPGAGELGAWLRAQPDEAFLIREGAPDGRAAPADSEKAWTHGASYTRPYLMHASIGPSAAMALWERDHLTIWTHSQGVYVLREALAQALGLEQDTIRAVHVVGPGCYGHNGADDAAFDAALLAMAAPGRPVLLKWSRADEHQWEPYGSPALVELRAVLDERGRIADWSHEVWGTTHRLRPMSDGSPNLLAGEHLDPPIARRGPAPFLAKEAGIHRNATPIYELPRSRVVKHFVAAMPLRTSSLRSLGAYANVFAIESFMDELAAASGRSPLEFRLAHLGDPRAREVLEAAAHAAGWDGTPSEPAGRGSGVALARYKNSAAYAAVVVSLRVDDATAAISLERIVIAADCGEVVDPSGAINQLEGGALQSASWTLKEQVAFDETSVTSIDWDSYPILRFSEVPAVDTHLLDRPGLPFLGTGEATQGPTAAAIANAVADAVGLRLRDTPFTPARVREAALAAA
jgi:CO/xanthine dehydrogenase Mo-binding subunit